MVLRPLQTRHGNSPPMEMEAAPGASNRPQIRESSTSCHALSGVLIPKAKA